jgi:hypothetical protein
LQKGLDWVNQAQPTNIETAQDKFSRWIPQETQHMVPEVVRKMAAEGPEAYRAVDVASLKESPLPLEIRDFLYTGEGDKRSVFATGLKWGDSLLKTGKAELTHQDAAYDVSTFNPNYLPNDKNYAAREYRKLTLDYAVDSNVGKALMLVGFSAQTHVFAKQEHLNLYSNLGQVYPYFPIESRFAQPGIDGEIGEWALKMHRAFEVVDVDKKFLPKDLSALLPFTQSNLQMASGADWRRLIAESLPKELKDTPFVRSLRFASMPEKNPQYPYQDNLGIGASGTHQFQVKTPEDTIALVLEAGKDGL